MTFFSSFDTTLEDSANLMQGKTFYFKLKFSAAKTKKLRKQDIS